MSDEYPVLCARCGRAQLLLLVFYDGLICRARVGCSCASFPLFRDEIEQVNRGRDELVALWERAAATRTAS